MIYDEFDDAMWVKEFFTILIQYSIKMVKVLGKAGVNSIVVNESYFGIGMLKICTGSLFYI
jgi:hypothetical protein